MAYAPHNGYNFDNAIQTTVEDHSSTPNNDYSPDNHFNCAIQMRTDILKTMGIVLVTAIQLMIARSLKMVI